MTDATNGAMAPEAAARRAKASNLYRAVWRWHLYAGLSILPLTKYSCGKRAGTRAIGVMSVVLLTTTAPLLAQTTGGSEQPITLGTIVLHAGATPSPGQASEILPELPGGQLAAGTALGPLGNRDGLSTPFSTQGFTSTLAERQGARSVSDVVINDASVATLFPRQSYRDVFRIRGFNYFSYNMLFMGLPGMLPKQRVLPQNAERIELFKGPDTFLNGTVTGGTVGGSLNLIPKRASDTPVREVTLGYASDGQPSAHLDWGQRFGANDAFGVRANATWRDGDLTVDNQEERLGSLALGLDWRGDAVRLSADLGWQNARTTAPDWTIVPSGAVIPDAPDGTSGLVQPWSWMETRDAFVVLGAEVDLSETWTAYAKGGYAHTETEGVYTEMTGLQANGDFTWNAYSFPSGGDHTSLEAGLRGRVEAAGLRHDLVLSASYWDQRLSTSRSGRLATGSSNLYAPVYGPAPTGSILMLDDLGRTGRNTFSSLAFADTITALDDRLVLTLGGRWQKIKTANYARNTRYDESRFTPAIGAVWNATRDLSFYGNYVEALTEGGTAPASAINAGELLAPTVSRQIEAGVKFERGDWGGAISLFQIRQANNITQGGIYGPNGEQRNRGIELSFHGEPVAGLRVLGGVTLMDAVQKRTAGGVTDGNSVIGVPDWQAVIGLEWDVPQLAGLTLSGRVIHTDGQYVDAANTQSIPDWTRLDLGLSYAQDRAGAAPIIWRASVENVFDTSYWASAATGQVSGISRGAPRTLLVSATIPF